MKVKAAYCPSSSNICSGDTAKITYFYAISNVTKLIYW